MSYKIRIINPARAGKKVAKKKTKKKGKKRGSAKRSSARSGRSSAVATARASNPKRRRHRHSNPGVGGIVHELAPLAVGGIAASLAAGIASRIKMPLPVLGQPSAMAGEPWNVGQYAAAGAAAMFLPRFVGKFVDATRFRHGVMAIMAYKLVGGFLANKIPGNMLGASDGEMQVDAQGQTWIRHGADWLPMQGLVTANALDGLESRSPLDGEAEYIDAEYSQPMRGDSLTDLYSGGSY